MEPAPAPANVVDPSQYTHTMGIYAGNFEAEVLGEGGCGLAALRPRPLGLGRRCSAREPLASARGRELGALAVDAPGF